MAKTTGSIQETNKPTIDALIAKFKGTRSLFINDESRTEIILNLDEIQNLDDEGEHPNLYSETEAILSQGNVDTSELTIANYLTLYCR